MDEALIELVIPLLHQEAHLLIIESINLGWMQDLHHAHMIGGVLSYSKVDARQEFSHMSLK